MNVKETIFMYFAESTRGPWFKWWDSQNIWSCQSTCTPVYSKYFISTLQP